MTGESPLALFLYSSVYFLLVFFISLYPGRLLDTVGRFLAPLKIIALAVLGIAAFGSGRLFQKRFTCVMFFSGSITGLSIGSPVQFRGVKIGQVTKIAAVNSGIGARKRVSPTPSTR